MGKYGTAPHTDTDSHAYAEPNSLDLADSFCVPDSDSDVQRDTLAHVTTANPSHIRVSDANAERIVLTGIKKSGKRPTIRRLRVCRLTGTRQNERLADFTQRDSFRRLGK